MPTYDSLISRTDAAALIPEEVSREIIASMPEQSAVMQLSRRLPNMSRKQYRLPVMSALLDAYFVTGDTGLKQTSEANWENKYVTAEELAVVVPIPENVVADTDYDVWGEIAPYIVQAFGKAFDAAVLYGTNAPTDWPDDLLTGATSASHTVTLGTGTDLYSDIMEEGGTIALVEEDGFMVNGHISALSMRAKLRGLRDNDNNLIFKSSVQEASRYELDGSPVYFPRNGSIAPASALMFTGDWDQLVYSVRQDITFKIFTEGVISDASGNVVLNLMQQDAVALRAVMRLGWQLPNPINPVNTSASTRYPFSVLLPAG